MKTVTCFLILHYIVSITASKPRSVNLALETVLEFDQIQKEGDITLIDQVQEFLDKVKKVIHHKHSFRRNLDGSKLKFSDFLINAFEILSTYDDDALEDALTVIDDEIRKYHYRGCKFYEVLENENVRRFIAEKLNALKVKSIKKIRNTIKVIIVMLKHGHIDDKTRKLLEYINNLYQRDSEKKFHAVLKNLKAYSYKNRRNNLNLIKIVRTGLRDVFFDHYSDLNQNARKDFNIQLDGLWNDFNDPFRIKYSIWTNDDKYAATPSGLRNKPAKVFKMPNPYVLRENIFSNHADASANYEHGPPETTREPVKANFIDLDPPKIYENESEADISQTIARELTTATTKSKKIQVSEDNISKINKDYQHTKKDRDYSSEDASVTTSKPKKVRSKKHKSDKKHKTTTTTTPKRKHSKSKKNKQKEDNNRHTVIPYYDEEQPVRRQTTATRAKLHQSLWTEKIKLKPKMRSYVTARPDEDYQQSSFEEDERRQMKFDKMKHRFEYQRHHTSNMRRRLPGNVIRRLSSGEGMSIESSGFVRTSFRKSNGKVTENPKANTTDSSTLEKIRELEKDLKDVKEQIKLTKKGKTFDKLSFWESTIASTSKDTTYTDKQTSKTVDSTTIGETTAKTDIPKATKGRTTPVSIETETEPIHFRHETTNVTSTPKTTTQGVENSSDVVNELKMVVPFTAESNITHKDVENLMKGESKHEIPMKKLRETDDISEDLALKDNTLHPNDTRKDSFKELDQMPNELPNVREEVPNAIIEEVKIESTTAASTATTDMFDMDEALDFL